LNINSTYIISKLKRHVIVVIVEYSHGGTGQKSQF